MDKKVVAVIFLILLIYNANLPESHARILLAPYAAVVELFYNNAHVYKEGTGFVETAGNYIIGRDCLGLRFTSALFLLCALYPLKYLMRYKKAVWVAFSGLFSIFAGFIVNSVRILNSLTFLSHKRFYALHAATGAALYLFVLCAAYFLLVKAFSNNEQELKGEK